MPADVLSIPRRDGQRQARPDERHDAGALNTSAIWRLAAAMSSSGERPWKALNSATELT
jgi:hypothetical protein